MNPERQGPSRHLPPRTACATSAQARPATHRLPRALSTTRGIRDTTSSFPPARQPRFLPCFVFVFLGLSFGFLSFLLLMTFGWTPIGGPMSEGSSRGSESFIPLASVTRRRARVIVLQAKLLHRSLASQTTASRQGIH